MHYYSFNIGDYASHTRHLSELEDLAYRRLLDLYYLHEQPLNECSTTVARLINMRKHEDEVKAVLEEFFSLVPGRGWVNSRADSEIEKYHGKIESASKAGKASAQRRLNKRSTDVQPNKKQETGNIKQETEDTDTGATAPVRLVKKTRHEKFVPKTWLTTRGVPIDIVEDWLKIRIAKKLVHTERAFEAVAKEAAQANMSLPDAIEYCVRKSWGGFEAQWIENERSRAGNGGNSAARMTHAQASTLAAARTIFGDERKLQNGQGNVIDVTPSPVTGFLDSKDI